MPTMGATITQLVIIRAQSLVRISGTLQKKNYIVQIMPTIIIIIKFSSRFWQHYFNTH